MDIEHREWLEKIAAACENVLGRDGAGDPDDELYAAVLRDVAGLLSRVRSELAQGGL